MLLLLLLFVNDIISYFNNGLSVYAYNNYVYGVAWPGKLDSDFLTFGIPGGIIDFNGLYKIFP